MNQYWYIRDIRDETVVLLDLRRSLQIKINGFDMLVSPIWQSMSSVLASVFDETTI